MTSNSVLFLAATSLVVLITAVRVLKIEKKDLNSIIENIYDTLLSTLIITVMGAVIGLAVLVVVLIAQFIIRWFSPTVAGWLDFFGYAYYFILFAFVAALYLTIVTMVALSGFSVPLVNYTKAISEVYNKNFFGRLYCNIWSLISILVPVSLMALAVARLFPIAWGQVVLRGDLEPNSLTHMLDNGCLQSGGVAFITEDGYYDGCIRYKDSDKTYKIISYNQSLHDEEISEHDGIDSVGVKLPNYVAVGDVLLGVTDKKLYLSTTEGEGYRITDYNWKKKVMTDDKYDYDKIWGIVQKQFTESISYEEAASIIGCIQEGVLIGIDEEGFAILKENHSDGVHFYKKSEKEKIELLGVFNLNQNKPIEYLSSVNQIICVNTDEVLCRIFLEDMKYDPCVVNDTEGGQRWIYARYFSYYQDEDQTLLVVEESTKNTVIDIREQKVIYCSELLHKEYSNMKIMGMAIAKDRFFVTFYEKGAYYGHSGLVEQPQAYQLTHYINYRLKPVEQAYNAVTGWVTDGTKFIRNKAKTLREEWIK